MDGMRNRIGWKEVFPDGEKCEINATVQQGRVVWKRQRRRGDTWETFAPWPDLWPVLLDKMDAAYRRRHVSYDDLVAARAAAKRSAAP